MQPICTQEWQKQQFAEALKRFERMRRLVSERDALREQLAARERLAAGPCCDCDGRGERSGARRGGD